MGWVRRGRRGSVLVNPEDADPVKLGQFGDEHDEQRHGVDHEVGAVVFGVEAGEDVAVKGEKRFSSEDCGEGSRL